MSQATRWHEHGGASRWAWLAVLALVLAVVLAPTAAAHDLHGAAGPHERLAPEERARLRDELRWRAVEARRDLIVERGHGGPMVAPEGWQRLSPEERRELRAMLREERRRRHRSVSAAQTDGPSASSGP